MRKLAAVAFLGLSACVDPLAIDAGTGIELMKGSGAAAVAADGSRSFRYAFAPGTDRPHHEAMIAQWAAKSDGCPRGYSIAKVETVQGMTVYSGPCR